MSYVHGGRCENYLKLHRLGTFVMQAFFSYILTDHDYQLYLMMLEMVTIRLLLSPEQQARAAMKIVLASPQGGPEPVLKWPRIKPPREPDAMLLWLV